MKEATVRADGLDSSLARMLGTLGFFSRNEPVLAVERIAERASVPVSTAYRYVQHLVKVGLLVRWKGGYTLGPRIMELDLQIRECDPLIRTASESMRQLCATTGLDSLLTEMYGASIMTIHIESAGTAPLLSYGRGRPLPLFSGSSSKVIIAFLPAAKLHKLFEAHPAAAPEIQRRTTFLTELRRIRKQGYCITKGELNNGIEGISAPIFDDGQDVLGSLTLIGDVRRMELLREETVVDMVRRAAASISEQLR